MVVKEFEMYNTGNRIIIMLSIKAEFGNQIKRNPGGTYVAQGSSEKGFIPSTSVFPCQYHSTIAP